MNDDPKQDCACASPQIMKMWELFHDPIQGSDKQQKYKHCQITDHKL